MQKIYLAGQITGLDYDEANDWRVEVSNKLRRAGLVPLNPLRAKEYLREYGTLHVDKGYEKHPLSSKKGIVTRDRNDVINSDIILMNLLDMDRVSIGCMIEIGWADMLRKPIIIVLDEDTPYNHEFIHEIAGYIVHNLNDALDIVYAIADVHNPDDMAFKYEFNKPTGFIKYSDK